MFEWLRKIPHPGYGKCGGANRDCSPTPPRDWMDRAFEAHDKNLAAAKSKTDRKQADHALARILRAGDPKALSWRGKIYRRISMLIFRP